MEKEKVTYSEIPIKEYPSFHREEREGYETRFRIRSIKRKEATTGIVRTYIDIRKYLVDEKKAMFTRQGIYFFPREIPEIINTLQQAQKDLSYGTDQGNRKQDPGSDQGEGKLA